MLYVIQSIIALLGLAAVLRAAVGQDTQHRKILCFKEQQDAIIEQVDSGNGCLGDVRFGKRHLAVCADKGLLIDPACAFKGANIRRVL